MTDLDTLVGPVPAAWLRTLYAERRAQARLEGCWNAPAHEEALSVVEWFASGVQSGMLEFGEWLPVESGKTPPLEPEPRQRQMVML